MRHKTIPGFRESRFPDRDTAKRLQELRPYVRQSGDDLRPKWLLKERKLLDYLLVYIASGEGVFTVAGETFTVSSGDLVWIPPDTLHEMSGTSDKMHCLYIHFDLLYDSRRSHWDACMPGGIIDLSAWKEFMHPPLSDPVIAAWCGILPVSCRNRMVELLEMICAEHRLRPGTSSLKLSGMMLELLALLIEDFEAVSLPQAPHHQQMREAADLIRLQALSVPNLKKLAARFSLSESHFRKLFRETHGISCGAMLRQARMFRAAEMLAYSAENISEIAERLGFSSVHNFSRAFKTATSLTPSQYRNGKMRVATGAAFKKKSPVRLRAEDF